MTAFPQGGGRYSERPAHLFPAVLSLCRGSSRPRREADRPGPEGPARLALPAPPAACLASGISLLMLDVGFSRMSVFSQLLRPVNMTMASADNRIQVGAGCPGSAAAGVAGAVQSLAHLGGPLLFGGGGLGHSPTSLPPVLWPNCHPHRRPPAAVEDAQRLQVRLAPASSGCGPGSFSAVLE